MTNGTPGPREQRIQQVIAAYREAEQAGVAPDPEELLRRHPNLAKELQAFFADRDRSAQPVATGEFRESGPAPGESPPARAETSIGSFRDYELLEEIARGGMGIVYKARQNRLNRLVALKMILAGQFASPADVQRFRMEAEAAAGLDHPHIVPIYEVGEYQGQHYFSMKLIDGGSLAQVVGSGPWAVSRKAGQRRVARFLAKVARAVHYAHQRRILHRDLKPANILLDAQGEPHVTDFGLAKRVASNSRLTQSGTVVGTPSYMAPEQARAEKGLSTAADVYSLGAVLYEMLTGRPPFQAATPLDTLLQVLEREPVPPGSYEPEINRDLETICLKCLEKEPARRYGSAEALAEDLERWLAGEPIQARRSGMAERVVKWAKRRPAIAALAALVVLVTCLGVGGIVWQWQDALAAEHKALNLAATEAAAWRGAMSAQEHEAQARRQAEQAKTGAEQAQAREAVARNAEQKAKEKAEAERDAKAQALTRAEGLRIAAESAAARHTDPALSLLLGIEGVRRMPNHLTYHALYAALNACREERTLAAHWKVMPPEELALVLQGHQGAIHALAFSPDGRRLLTAAKDETPRLWDSAAGKEVLALGKGKQLGEVRSAQFSGDGRRVITASANATVSAGGKVINPSAVHIWDAATGADHLALKEHGMGAAAALLSPDGQRVLTVSDGHIASATGGGLGAVGGLFHFSFNKGGTDKAGLVRLWDAATGKLLITLPKPMDQGFVPVFSPDGQWLLVHYAQEPVVRLIDAATGKQDRPLRWGQMGYAGPFAAFSPDGRRVMTIQGQGVYLWETPSGRWLATLKGFDGSVVFAAFSPDGKRLTTLSKNVAYVWNLDTRELVQTFKGHEAEVVAAAFSPDGKQLLTGSKDRTAVLWDVATGKVRSLYEGHTDAVTRVAFRPDGRQVATGSADGTVRLWPVDLWPAILSRRPRELTQAERERYELPAAVVQAKQPKASPAPQRARGPFAEPPPGAVFPEVLTISPQALDRATEQQLAGQLRELQGQVKAGLEDPQAVRRQLLALQAAYPGTSFAAQAAALLGKLPSPYDGLDSAQIPPEERFPWQPKELVAVLGEHRLRHWGDVERVAISPDGQLVATGGQDNIIRLWDNATLRERATLPGSLAGFSADGHTLIGLVEKQVRFWDLTQTPPHEQKSFQVGNQSVLALSPDGKMLALRGEGSAITLWDLAGPQLRKRATLPGHPPYVRVAAFSADGHTLRLGAQVPRPGIEPGTPR